MNDGGGKKKGKKGKKAESAERDDDVWAGLAQFEQQAPAEEPVKPPPSKEPVKPPPSNEPVNPMSGAPSTSGAAVDVEAQRLADDAFVRENMPPGWDGNPNNHCDRGFQETWREVGRDAEVKSLFCQRTWN
jgi:hypothetical protein